MAMGYVRQWADMFGGVYVTVGPLFDYTADGRVDWHLIDTRFVWAIGKRVELPVAIACYDCDLYRRHILTGAWCV